MIGTYSTGTVPTVPAVELVPGLLVLLLPVTVSVPAMVPLILVPRVIRPVGPLVPGIMVLLVPRLLVLQLVIAVPLVVLVLLVIVIPVILVIVPVLV